MAVRKTGSAAERGSSDPTSGTAVANPTDDQVRERAYFLSLERGGRHADPLGDWLQAERELRSRGAGRPQARGAGKAKSAGAKRRTPRVRKDKP